MRLAPLIELARPFTLLPPVLGMVTGSVAALGAVHPDVVNRETFLRIALGALMAATLNAASNILNQIFDLAIDRVNKPQRPLPSGRVTRRVAGMMAAAAYAAALLMAWFIDSGAGRECFVIVVFTAWLTWAYSGPPFRWRRFGWRANFVVALPRGLLLKVAGWSCVAPVFRDVEPWYLGSIFFLFLLGATTTKDVADVLGDSRDGVRNLAVRHGPAGAARRIAPFFVFPWLLLPLGAILPGPPLSASPLPLALLGAALALAGAMIARRLVGSAGTIAQMGENHPAWRGMYLLMMTAQLGTALVYHF